MTGRLKILFKVIQRRVQAGENRDTVIANYNLLTDAEKAEIITALDAAGTEGSNA
ncbi:hypothetical protein [Faecalispora jeddahensis]|uniref:hypothetical protein n=1 Tax=Faecalispora jeddahensis TaxID=1414721 RepID=UPI0004B3C8C9|nr:hypothetical protein [Faecalispora jeddahensis]